MAFIVLPYPDFVPLTKIKSAEVDADFAAIVAQVNGNLDNTNIAPGALIQLSKLDLSNNATFTGDITFDGEVIMTGGDGFVDGVVISSSGGPGTVTISYVAGLNSRTIQIPNSSVDAFMVLTEGTQTINGNKTFGDSVIMVDGASNRYVGDIGTTNSGFSSNIGIALNSGATGRVKIISADGSVFSASNAGYIGVPSELVSGRIIVLKATSDIYFFDDLSAATSDIIGEEFGTTAAVAWADERPFTIYAVNADDTDAGLQFAISPNPCAVVSPATTNIGYHGNPAATPSDINFFFLTSTNVTVTHANKRCSAIGTIEMTKNASDDWDCPTINGGDGIGQFNEGTLYTMPIAQMGAPTGKYFKDNGGTAPIFSSNAPRYAVGRNGYINYNFAFTGDGGTDGAGAVTMQLASPYFAVAGQERYGVTEIVNPTYNQNVTAHIGSSTSSVTFTRNASTTTLAVINNGDFTNGARTMFGNLVYKAFSS